MRFLVGSCLALIALVIPATPAHGHGAGGATSTNYASTIESIEPKVNGLRLRVIEGGDQLELKSTMVETTVLGYEGEPYLRVGPEGTFANRNSPAFYLNRSATGNYKVPEFADPKKAPDWDQLSDDPVALWHDHRVHWMAKENPPLVRNAPNQRHLVIPEWKVTMLAGAQEVVATGRLEWIPGPNTLYSYLAAGALGLGVFVLSLTKYRRDGLAAALGVLLVVNVLHNAGTLGVAAGSGWARLVEALEILVPAAVGWVVGVVAMKSLWRRQDSAPWLLLFSAGIFLLLGGLLPFESLSRSQIVFIADPMWARLLVATSLGIGSGLVAAAFWQIYRQGSAESQSSIEN